MIKRIEEIDKALKNDMPESALALTLTLPDICGQIEAPNEKKVGKRYKDWISKNVALDKFDVYFDGLVTSANSGVDPKLPKMDAEAIYRLRCHFLHSGDADIHDDSTVSNMDHFVLKKIGCGEYEDANGRLIVGGFTIYIERDEDGKETKHYEIDIKYLCDIIVDAARRFYEQIPDKHVFLDHAIEIVD
ncbi:hypothetical protein [Butyrivibrio fibrisolvens]|uniref:hypothetical protein n=1 Tax=Butyrivibrio fibrisolvens TaxID=831 RepID=UPI0003F76227|nr:hypothetical protein [Butyrivibrio fibrisolvens]